MEIRYILLDIDDVLSVTSDTYVKTNTKVSIKTKNGDIRETVITPEKMEIIKRLHDRNPKIEIMIVSSWRYLVSEKQILALFKKHGIQVSCVPLFKKGFGYKFTESNSSKKATDIGHWINNHKINHEEILLIDDDASLICNRLEGLDIPSIRTIEPKSWIGLDESSLLEFDL